MSKDKVKTAICWSSSMRGHHRPALPALARPAIFRYILIYTYICIYQALLGQDHQALIGSPINRGPIDRMSPLGTPLDPLKFIILF